MNSATNQATEIFRKTTGKGAVLVVTFDGRLGATVDGKAADAALRTLDAPKTINGKTIIASIGGIGLTREERDAIELAWRGPVVETVVSKHQRAVPMTLELAAELRAFERGAARKAGLETE